MKNIINVIYHLMYHHKTVSYIRYISLSYHHGRPKHHRQKSPNQGHPTVETQSRTPGRADLGCPTVFFSEEDMGNSTRKYGDQEWNIGYIYIYMCVCLCPSHHWWMANEEANDESCKRTCDLPPSDMANLAKP